MSEEWKTQGGCHEEAGSLLAVLALGLSGMQPAGAGPTAGGFASDNVEYVGYVPFQVGTATGAKVVGKFLYVTSWREFSIYDVSDPTSPEPFMTWDGSNWRKTHSLKLLDVYQLSNGTYQDGAPPVNGLGCSAHWFEEHQTFKNGGLVAMGSYEHGTRFVDIARNGKIKEAGYFVPYGGSTSAAYWLNKRIVYAVDYSRGIDILRWTDKF